ncbi:carboxylesterase/lipase family protein [Neobacillus sp. MM2021_6]|uniref:carboxylesterase/lipase family protein n=1 Tax=Bacillaceae TaxID=186817 RepID=UPI0014080023|nr:MULTISPECIES: carboxylesterase/lipase family protein [Bacillaceae]MBO0960050.1 carboxylesterase/lipase family protein [Neobacillus sp. MM2021_6]NHC21265.1 carboxylesterase/lipase family protein [Bacillus sp. MM2020_4]
MSVVLAKTRFGMVEGIREGEICIWKGIPYAAPPIHSLRFRAPQPPESWLGVREAKKFGPASLQSESLAMKFLGDSPTNTSEDCLYLNIWSPGSDTKRRPVMVWIHGGSFMYGSGSSHLYDGKSFAEQGNVVIVTLNYRLGVFGFLHLSDMGGEAYRGSGNCGLLDQVAALKWVKENIEAFGGDPNNITIFGESAGAVSVGNLLSMPIAKGLFHKAILQSGTARCKVPVEKANEMTEQLLSELQVNPKDLSELEKIPGETILKAINIFPRTAFGPVGDGINMSANPEKVLDEGFASDIPVLVGTTKDESLLFTHFDPMWEQMDQSTLQNFFELSFHPYWKNVSQYVWQGKEVNRSLYEDAMTHYVFTVPAYFFCASQARLGAPVWMYRFDYESSVSDGDLKAFHALEIPFVWNNLRNKETENMTGNDPHRYKLAEQMHLGWIAFAHHGDPNITELPNWPKYDLENRATMLFHTTCKVVHDPERQKRLNWEQVFQNSK